MERPLQSIHPKHTIGGRQVLRENKKIRYLFLKDPDNCSNFKEKL